MPIHLLKSLTKHPLFENNFQIVTKFDLNLYYKMISIIIKESIALH